jgi:nicotinamidase-related amidase
MEKFTLVLIDIQNESRFGIQGLEEVVHNSKQLLNACREAGIPVVYTRQINRSDGVGLSLGEELSADGRPVFYCSDTAAVDIIPDIAPLENELVVDKYRWSSFCATSLDIFLKGLGTRELILGGLVTDGCLMTSAFDAYFRDYRLHLVRDICATTCQGGHMASIMIMANWIYGLKIYRTSEMVKFIRGEPYCVWESKTAAPFAFTPENMREQYARLDSEAEKISG